MRWYHAVECLIENQTQETIPRAVVFQTGCWWGVICMGIFFLHLEHLLIYYVLPKLILKKHIVYTCFLMAFILQLQCFRRTNSDECFDQTQHSLHALQSTLLFHPTLIPILSSLFSSLMLMLPAPSTVCSFFPKYLAFYFALVRCQKLH